MRIVLLTVVLVLLPHPTSAQEVLDRILSKLDVHLVVSGQFSQERHVDFLQKPLASSGDFLINRDQSLMWRVLDPIESTMQIKKGVLTLNGKQVPDMGAGALMSVIIQSIFSGDFSQLKQHFEVEGEINQNNWTLQLVPKSNLLRKGIEFIRLDGSNHLSGISLHEKYGSRTTIRLHNLEIPG